jgi:hypothetical protein
VAKSGNPLPNARAVSFTLFPDIDIQDNLWTLVAMQWGQFISHDMGLIDGTTQSSKQFHTRSCTTTMPRYPRPLLLRLLLSFFFFFYPRPPPHPRRPAEMTDSFVRQSASRDTVRVGQMHGDSTLLTRSFNADY